MKKIDNQPKVVRANMKESLDQRNNINNARGTARKKGEQRDNF